MTTRKSEKGGPREPHNIPIRFYGADDILRGAVPFAVRGKSRKRRRLATVAESKKRVSLIEVNFDIQGGNPVIKGTRVPVRVVLGALGAGESMAEVCREYHIPWKAALAAISYAAEILSREVILEILGDEAF
jgi:uncharacterized protein (DUF433 family)